MSNKVYGAPELHTMGNTTILRMTTPIRPYGHTDTIPAAVQRSNGLGEAVHYGKDHTVYGNLIMI